MNRGVVIARGGLKLRKSPKTGTVQRTLRKGSKVDILDEETWLSVRASDGSVGYVLADQVERDATELVEGETEPAAIAIDPASVLGLAQDERDVCDIRVYRNSQFIGKELRADIDFIPHLDRLNRYALDCGVEIYVTSSARQLDDRLTGTVVPPASRSNHLVGHAIDMNLSSASGFFNSGKLKKANLGNLPAEIRQFIGRVRADEVLRWGGDFNPQDPVHIDDNFNHRNPARWDAKFASRR